MIKVNTEDKIEDNNISSARHRSTYDTDSINRALERAIKDDTFVSNAIKLLKGIEQSKKLQELVAESSVFKQGCDCTVTVTYGGIL